jgi:hypothetical protein
MKRLKGTLIDVHSTHYMHYYVYVLGTRRKLLYITKEVNLCTVQYVLTL